MIEVKSVSFADHEANIRFIRNAVFSGDQGIDPERDFDGNDSAAVHALAFVDGNPAGTGRLLNDGHIGRVAVLSQYRGKGVGSEILECLVAAAAGNGYSRVYLGSQKQACEFYAKRGFTPYGEVYMEVHIEHQLMERILVKP
jgi:hypothetical protein